MRLGYVFLAAVVSLTLFLNGCITNRIETYEPYSTFDDRMAAVQKDRPYPPDDQMPPASDDHYASSGYEGFSNDGEASEPARMADRRSGSDQGDEVPFSSSRSTKHAMNIGAY